MEKLLSDPRGRTLESAHGRARTKDALRAAAARWGRGEVEDVHAEPTDVRRLLLRDLALRALKDIQSDRSMAADIAAWSQTIAWLKGRIEAIESAAPEDPPDEVTEGELLGWLAHRGEGDP